MDKNTGGFLVGRKDGKIYVHNDADLGGFIVGRRHSEGGVKGYNYGSNQPIEVEGGEIQIASAAIKDQKPNEFNGRKMTNREILSYLNEKGGGIRFDSGGKVENEYKKSDKVVDKGAGNPIEYQGGEVILTRGAVSNPEKFNFNGKQMTTREIASQMNEKAGGVAFSKGGNTTNPCGCNDTMESGGVNGSDDYDLISKMDIEDKINGSLYQKFRLGEIGYFEFLKATVKNRRTASGL